MCGIFGVFIRENCAYKPEFIRKLIYDVAKFSEIRGKDSSGIVLRDRNAEMFKVIKGPLSISRLLTKPEVKLEIEKALCKYENGDQLAVIGHSRLVTNGNQLLNENNQPVIKNDIIGIHNGIIVNVDELWMKYPNLTRQFEIDTEILLALIELNVYKNKNLLKAIQSALKNIKGTLSIGVFLKNYNNFFAFSNNGSLYLLTNNFDFLVFASERNIIEKIFNKFKLSQISQNYLIYKIFPNQGVALDFKTFQIKYFQLYNSNNENIFLNKNNSKYKIETISIIDENTLQRPLVLNMNDLTLNFNFLTEASILEYNFKEISALKRCKTCLLPETFPYISFDSKGTCNICNNYKPKNQSNILYDNPDIFTKWRKTDGKPDCLVPFSGGRDSSYMLHYLVNELHLNPITFTYDWGMVTDLARRNIARLCGKLGIENIVVSADIRLKRENIKKNVTAWLKNPSLGMIPLFMVGDKLFFYYINKLLRETQTNVCFTGSNSLENTDFKTGFSGIAIDYNKKIIDSLNFTNKILLLKYISKNVFINRSYLNSSIYDSFISFLSRYFLSRKNIVYFFGLVEWNEKVIEDVLINQYEWELASDTKSSWRIGDGTVGFYNYIYYTVAGFSEIETFRSNQIREGHISRDEGLSKIFEENKPRYESIKWYLETIGLDFVSTIKTINNIPKLYRYL